MFDKSKALTLQQKRKSRSGRRTSRFLRDKRSGSGIALRGQRSHSLVRIAWTSKRDVHQAQLRRQICVSPQVISLVSFRMAFEIPLDADRVDDLNLFSTLVRAPVIGTLLWILGGSKSQREEDGGNDQRIDDDADNCHDVRNSSASTGEFSRHTRTALKKAAPSLVGSEISECDLTESLDAVSLYGYSGSTATHCIHGMSKKELSWSDDAGRDLVIYEEVRRTNVPYCYFVRSYFCRLECDFVHRHSCCLCVMSSLSPLDVWC